MDRFTYRDGVLWCEDVPAAELADRFGTPVYVYSQGTLWSHFDQFRAAFSELRPRVCYSVKCCHNVHLLTLLREWGSGFDVVSGGELHRALLAGADPAGIVFAGVGKTDAEVRAALAAGVGLFNVESESELNELAATAARLGATACAALRVNPDVDPKTHKYTATGKKEAKFGVPLERGVEVFERHARTPGLKLSGLHLHIGSPVLDLSAYTRSIERALALTAELRGRGFTIDTLDMGGGFGADYQGQEAPTAAEYARAIVPPLRGQGLQVILEPGRSIAANAGIILTRVLHVKAASDRRFVIVDAAMTELIRPALYGAYHFIWPVAAGAQAPRGRGVQQPLSGLHRSDVVGPVCESGDFLAQGRDLPEVRRGDLLAVFTAGAYGMVMASQYNSRPRAPEVLVNGTAARLIRRRETYADLVAAETDL